MPGLEIIHRKSRSDDRLDGAGLRSLEVPAGAQLARCFLHDLEQDGRDAAFLGRQVDVARRHRQPVTLAHGFGTDHLDAKVEVGSHARHHPQLLEILFAEDGDVGPALRE